MAVFRLVALAFCGALIWWFCLLSAWCGFVCLRSFVFDVVGLITC